MKAELFILGPDRFVVSYRDVYHRTDKIDVALRLQRAFNAQIERSQRSLQKLISRKGMVQRGN